MISDTQFVLFGVVVACLVCAWVAFVMSRSDEVVIGKLAVERPIRANPRECHHSFNRDNSFIVEAAKPNRHSGIVCENCRAILWENGDITITRA